MPSSPTTKRTLGALRRSLTLAAAVAMCMTASASADQVAGIPQHTLGAQYCDGGQIRITVPQHISPWTQNTREYVYFQADIYRWTSNGWTRYSGTPWARAIAGPYGLESAPSWEGTFWSWHNGTVYYDYMNPVKRFSVPSGTYMVLQQIVWGSHMNSPHAEAPLFVKSYSRYCQQ